ncbi:DUF4328 domain-containing protein [Kitasatospora sp. NPDC086791]|uniref:DUF4328 domain-containing protein n=1 Tax=Kitasatospora sp. NPDC086791 TaxID=3155178 RepID=UPI0034464032
MRDRSRTRAGGPGPVADPGALAVAAQVLIALQTAAQVAVGVAGGTRSELFARFVPLSLPLFVTTVVVFLCWFRRCRLNAGHFAPGTQRHSAGLAVGAWFIPVVMWWVPLRVALDIRRANRPAGANPPAGGEWLINAWWVAWLGKTIGAVIAIRLGAPRPYPYSLYDEVVGVVAAVLAILVIRQITAGQTARIRADLKSVRYGRTSSH